MLDRRTVLLSGTTLLAACAAGGISPMTRSRAPDFVRRQGTSLTLGGEPYHFVGTNMWYAAYLGADAPFGNRDRLRRELDALGALGIDNLRILGSSELSPLKNSITPAFARRMRTTTKGFSAASISRSPRWAGATCAPSSTSPISGNGQGA